MADDTVEVRYTGDVTDLVAKQVLLKNEVRNLNSTIQEYATTMNSMSTRAAESMKAGLVSLVSQLMTTRDNLRSVTSQIKEYTSAVADVEGPKTLQTFIAEAQGLDRSISSASKSARIFSQSLAHQGVSATEAAIELKRLREEQAKLDDQMARSRPGIVQASGRAQVQAVVNDLMGLKQAQDRVTESNSALAAQWRQTVGVMNVTPAKTFWDNFNQSIGITQQRVRQASASDFPGLTKMVDGTKGAFDSLTFATAGASREIIVLAHEAVQGNFSRMPGSLMVLAERMGGLNLATVGWGLALGAVAGIVGYFTVKAVEASYAMDRIAIGAQFAGNFNMMRDSLASFTTKLDWMAGVSREDAEMIVGAFARMRNMTEPQLQGLAFATLRYAQVMGVDLKQALDVVSKAMENNNVSADELLKIFPGLTHAQMETVLAAQRNGDSHATAAAMIDLFRLATEKTGDEVVRYNSRMFASLSNFATYTSMMAAGIPFHEVQAMVLEAETKRWNEQTEAIKNAARAKEEYKLSADDILVAADRAAAAQDQYSVQLRKVEADIKKLKEGIEAAKNIPEDERRTEALKRYNEALRVAQGQLERLNELQRRRADFGTDLSGQQAIQKAQVKISDINTNEDVAASERLEQIKQVWAEILAGERLTAKQRNEVIIEMNKSIAAAERAAGAEVVANARLNISEIQADQSKSSAERLAEVRAVWAKVLESDRLTAQQRISVQREMNNSIRQFETAAINEQSTIARDAVRVDLEISRERMRSQRQFLEEQVQLGRITEQEKLQSLRQFAQDELAINLQMLELEQKNYNEESAAYQRMEQQKRLEKARTANEIARIDRELAQAYNREQIEEIRMNRMKVQAIMAAENTLIDDLFSGQQTLGMSLLRATDAFLKKELQATAAYVTQRLLIKETGHKADMAMEQGGFLVKLLFGQKTVLAESAMEAEKTAATIAGSQTRNAARASELAVENAGFLGRLFRWIATELGMTKATVGAEIAKTSAKTTAAATATTITSATNAAMGVSFAALSAIEAAASVAAIPYVGWAMAPGVAAEQFAAMAPFMALTALEVGAWNIPRNMPAYLHGGEMVVPKTYAAGLRESITSQQGGLRTSANTEIARAPDVHLSYAPVYNAPHAPNLPQMVDRDSRYMVGWVENKLREGALRIEPA